jgi:hypothetical protein
VFVVSQGGSNAEVPKAIDGFAASIFEEHPQFGVSHNKHPQSAGNGYQNLSKHFGCALHTCFNGLHIKVENVLILEDDLEVAPDFF